MLVLFFSQSYTIGIYLLLISIVNIFIVRNLNFFFADFLSKSSTMVKIMKNQKVVIVLAGRYAGRKAVVIKVIILPPSEISRNPNHAILAT